MERWEQQVANMDNQNQNPTTNTNNNDSQSQTPVNNVPSPEGTVPTGPSPAINSILNNVPINPVQESVVPPVNPVPVAPVPVPVSPINSMMENSSSVPEIPPMTNSIPSNPVSANPVSESEINGVVGVGVSNVTEDAKKPGKLFYLIVIVTVVLFLTLLAFMAYMLKSNLTLGTSTAAVPPTPEIKQQAINSPPPLVPKVTSDPVTDQLNQQSGTDEIEEINKDLTTTDFSLLDKEVPEIEKGFTSP
ncbi:MAG: hypothetical protein UT63_C0006G0008 [Candidatus Gottesmanbacteria bacterium GW2011_GWC2_39_8]|uniref:Uncharacterized protein n=1 Tax=Candidatus Gottesmanbacteria bacterium GW2011_GWC2_39_8 TaxID=1618450 RepID=A0A0G0SHB4_9BACT|nr:MAG: hypothetical protein UT63_C0006G0008 [Candidatus Gottesmanbacteria bacterium GW2011_GWC2_39_8]